jgi:hypothetical protein
MFTGSLPAAAFVNASAYEDFTTFIEVDPKEVMTVNPSYVYWEHMDRSYKTGVYKSYGSGYFGDFEIQFEFGFKSIEAGDWSQRKIANFLVLSNEELVRLNDCIILYAQQHGSSDDKFNLVFHQRLGGDHTFVYVGITHTAKRTYYATVTRKGNNCRMRIYADAAHTDLLEDSGYIEGVSTRYEYVAIGIRKYPDDPYDWSTGYVANLEIFPAYAYNFRISPFGNVFHVDVDEKGWMNGYMTGGYTDRNPVLGKVEGDRICMAVDLAPDEAPGNYQMLFLNAKVSTQTGQFILTKDGMSYVGPLDVELVEVTVSEEPHGPDVMGVSDHEVAPDAWYTLRLNPYTNIVHIRDNPDGWLNGYLEANHPLLGFVEGERWYFAIDGLDTEYTLAFSAGSISELTGDMIITRDGKTYNGPLDIWLTEVTPTVEPAEGESLLNP